MTIHIFKSATDTARGLVEQMLEWVGEHPEPTFHIALSGGNTPALMFDVWAEEYLEATPWERLRFYWVDERCVGPTHPESNYGMTVTHLLSKVPVNPEQVFRIQGETAAQDEAGRQAAAEAECRRYASLIRREVPLKESMPMFDLVLLGAGDDGHTSSIFPGQEALLTTDELYAVGIHPVSGQKRVALTGKPILHASRVAFLMTGSGKAPVLKDMEGTADTGPAAYVAHHAHEVTVFADDAAGAQVSPIAIT